ncbi:MAG TPA: cytidine deaminase [Pyrinomonadaceae bacterium]|nr:cytidine deaminase [Pyrinomonadaceae bacterium]HWS86992.1 cytidine deaminase [Pyrinomonadaceae bacterium]
MSQEQQQHDGADAGRLVEAATGARECALARYSNFCVGAAVEADDGRVFTGCNIESAAYELTMCAERVTIWKALSEGARRFRRIAVVADTERLTPPCGACRQLIWEFCGDIPVVLANLRGDSETLRMSELLPRPFDADFLAETGAKE